MTKAELLALRWKDVDFKKGTIYVHENLQLISNSDGKPAQIYETQSLKNYQNRHIHINNKARHFLELQRKYTEYTEPDEDFDIDWEKLYPLLHGSVPTFVPTLHTETYHF